MFSLRWYEYPRALWSLFIGAQGRQYRASYELLQERYTDLLARCVTLAMRVEALDNENMQLRLMSAVREIEGEKSCGRN